jgi:hypothetical protein
MNYRKIYESHCGPIPKDSKGKSYEIHHLDGDHTNNDISNLKCVTIQEHYDIHYTQSDWGACFKMAKRMELSPAEISELASRGNHQRVKDGTHPFTKESCKKYAQARVENGTHHFIGPALSQKRVENGTHPFLGGEIQRKNNQKFVSAGKHNFQKRNDGTSVASDKTNAGSNPFQKRADGTSIASDKVKDGTHHFLHPKTWKCEHCGKEGKGLGGYTHWHGDNCKMVST